MNERTIGDGTHGSNSGRESDGGRSPNSARVSRRTYCRALAGGTVLATGLGTVDRAAGIEDEYGTVIDVTAEGAANDGTESVSPLLTELAGDDTLLRFPAGRYYMDQEVRVSSFHNLGIVGEDATLVPADYWSYDAPDYRLFRLGTTDRPGEKLRFEGFTVDQRAENTGIRAIEAQVTDGLHVDNVDVVGRHDTGTWGPALFTIRDPAGSGLVTGFRAPDGAEASVDTPGDIRYGPTGILCNSPHEGSITFEDCVLGAFPDNGLYAAGGTGDVHVVGGRYEDSGTASVRLGCDRGSITGVTVRAHEDPFELGREGIRLQYGSRIDVRNVTIDVNGPIGEAIRILDGVDVATLWNCSIDLTAPGHSTAIAVGDGAGFVRIFGGRIRHDGPSDSGGYGLILKGAGNSAGPHVERVSIEGTVGQSGGRAGIYNERNEARFVDTVVDQRGGRKRAGLVNRGTDCTVYRGEYRASRYPIDEHGTGTWIQEVSAESHGEAAAIRLQDSAQNVYLTDGTFDGGLSDAGAESVFVKNRVGL